MFLSHMSISETRKSQIRKKSLEGNMKKLNAIYIYIYLSFLDVTKSWNDQKYRFFVLHANWRIIQGFESHNSLKAETLVLAFTLVW